MKLSATAIKALEYLKLQREIDTAVAKRTKRSNRGGFAICTTRFRRPTLLALWKEGLIAPCCDYHGVDDIMRITAAGIVALDGFWMAMEKAAQLSKKAADWQKAGINLNPQHFKTFR